MSTTDFKYFCLNFDGLNDRDAEEPSKVQAIVKGKVFRHTHEEGGSGENSIRTMYVVAIERKPLLDYFKAIFSEELGESEPVIVAVEDLHDYLENDVWGDDDRYAAIIVQEPNM